jgi:hypothetical protein
MRDEPEPTTDVLPDWFLRRGQIIRLLETMNDGLPEPIRRDHSTSGFVNETRSRTCPDCLANGRVMFGCETCGGSGEVTPARLDAIAATDVLPDDGATRDPYAVSETVQPYGVTDTGKLGHVPARDAEIDRMREQTRQPFTSFEEELAQANVRPYVWERERAAMRRRYDYDRLTLALDELRVADAGLAALVLSVYGRRKTCRHAIEVGDRCRVCGVVEPAGFVEFSAAFEAGVERALRFIEARMPTPIRAPGDSPVAEHPASARIRRRKAA